MSQGGGPHPIAGLREAVARIERRGGGVPRPGRGPAAAPLVRLGDGTLPLDDALAGGLRRGVLHEVVAAHRRDDGAAAGFALAVAGLCAGRGTLVWIVEDRAARESGLPYRPGLAAHGIDPDRLVMVLTADARATLWAAEEALRLRAPAVLAELGDARPYGLAPSRRLLLAAEAGRGTAILVHAGLSGRGGTLSSAAETRFAVAACPSPRAASAGNRTPIPGRPAVTLRLLKLRCGGARAPADLDRSHPLVWNPERRCFDAHPLPVDLAAAAPHRQAPAAGGILPFRGGPGRSRAA